MDLFRRTRSREKDHWQFQENILLAKNIAITRSLDVTEWAALAISNRSFPEKLITKAEVKMKEGGQGIGFLLKRPGSRRAKKPCRKAIAYGLDHKKTHQSGCSAIMCRSRKRKRYSSRPASGTKFRSRRSMGPSAILSRRRAAFELHKPSSSCRLACRTPPKRCEFHFKKLVILRWKQRLQSISSQFLTLF